jgi:hypothetical protein
MLLPRMFVAVVGGCFLASAVAASAAEPVKTLLLLGQKPDGHPLGTHEYLPAQRILAQLLKGVPGLKTQVVQADDPWSEGPEQLARADGVVLFVSQGAKWIQDDPRRYEAFARLAQRKGGFTSLHWGTGTKEAADIDGFTRLFGACHGGPDRKYTVFDEVAVEFADPQHPIVAGLTPFRAHEEFYYRLKRPRPEAGTLRPLLTIPVDGGHDTVGWTFDRADGGRSFGFSGLHFHENWNRPEYRRLIAQGVLWTLHLPIPPDGLNVDLPADVLKLETE